MRKMEQVCADCGDPANDELLLYGDSIPVCGGSSCNQNLRASSCDPKLFARAVASNTRDSEEVLARSTLTT